MTETSSSRTAPSGEPIDITCADGVHIKGHFMPASGGSPGLPVLLCPATGVRQRFYLRFTNWLAAQGHDVLVFDYRGIGLSLQGALKDCRASLQEWGQQDQVAAINWLVQRTGAKQVLLLGHSVGGQMIGLLPNHPLVARVVGVAASSGWFGGMAPGFRMASQAVLRGAIPVGIRLKGYAPCAAFGLGEDLPSQVALQWGQWCAAGGYATNATRESPEQDFHVDVRCPITVFHATDDNIATPKTVADLLRTFPAAPSTTHLLKPADHGLKTLGHLDWFRTSHQAVWPVMASALRA